MRIGRHLPGRELRPVVCRRRLRERRGLPSAQLRFALSTIVLDAMARTSVIAPWGLATPYQGTPSANRREYYRPGGVMAAIFPTRERGPTGSHPSPRVARAERNRGTPRPYLVGSPHTDRAAKTRVSISIRNAARYKASSSGSCDRPNSHRRPHPLHQAVYREDTGQW